MKNITCECITLQVQGDGKVLVFDGFDRFDIKMLTNGQGAGDCVKEQIFEMKEFLAEEEVEFDENEFKQKEEEFFALLGQKKNDNVMKIVLWSSEYDSAVSVMYLKE